MVRPAAGKLQPNPEQVLAEVPVALPLFEIVMTPVWLIVNASVGVLLDVVFRAAWEALIALSPLALTGALVCTIPGIVALATAAVDRCPEDDEAAEGAVLAMAEPEVALAAPISLTATWFCEVTVTPALFGPETTTPARVLLVRLFWALTPLADASPEVALEPLTGPDAAPDPTALGAPF